MSNSTNPDSVSADFDTIQNRLRRTGAEGIKIAEGDNTKPPLPVDKEKDFEQRKRGMSVKGGAVIFTPNTRNVPNARPRQTESNDSEIKVFAVGEKKSEEDEEK